MSTDFLEGKTKRMRRSQYLEIFNSYYGKREQTEKLK